MTDMHIRHRRRSKHYMAPVLLDHRSLHRLGMSIVLALVVVFLSGYLVGFKKAENWLTAGVDTIPLKLAVVSEKAPVDLEPQPPEKAEPGETIDVDLADDNQPGIAKKAGLEPVHNVKTLQQKQPIQLAKAGHEPETHQVVTAVAETKAIEPEQPRLMAIGGPPSLGMEQEDVLLIQDTASEEEAKYTIQVGMYGQLENAERKVEELIASELSAYINEYLNRKNEIRYNVRFGYFADHKSAKQALATYEKVLAGSGYVVRLRRSQQVASSGL